MIFLLTCPGAPLFSGAGLSSRQTAYIFLCRVCTTDELTWALLGFCYDDLKLGRTDRFLRCEEEKKKKNMEKKIR